MRRFITALIALAAASLYMMAEGDLKRYEVNVGDFSELKVLEGLNVDYKCSEDSNGYVVFNAAPDIASVIMLNNNKSCLELQISTDGIDYQGLPRITVYSRFLNKVENDGDSLVRVMSVAPAASFRATLIGNGGLALHGVNTNNFVGAIKTGNGVIAVDGRTSKAHLSVIGTGSIQADALKATDIKCSLSGTGVIECSPESKLTVVATLGVSSGKVYYSGKPEIKDRAPGVKILPIE
ncbi:MAG: DUF2807 domain-containing protein [Muribaculum sp.]|nr:DUF2807 domain-containing protein [Muribaculum sp.]